MVSIMTQKYGLTVVIDCSNMSKNNIDLDFLRLFKDFFEEGLPVRLKNIIIYRPPIWIKALRMMLFPILKEKLRNRIAVAEDLDMWIDHANLPQSLSGRLEYDNSYMVQKIFEWAERNGEDVEFAFDKYIVQSISDHHELFNVQDARIRNAPRSDSAMAFWLTKRLLSTSKTTGIIDANQLMSEFTNSVKANSQYKHISTKSDEHKDYILMKDSSPVDSITWSLICDRLASLEEQSSDHSSSAHHITTAKHSLQTIIEEIPTLTLDDHNYDSWTGSVYPDIKLVPSWRYSLREGSQKIKDRIKFEQSSNCTETSYPNAIFYHQNINSGAENTSAKDNSRVKALLPIDPKDLPRDSQSDTARHGSVSSKRASKYVPMKRSIINCNYLVEMSQRNETYKTV